MSIFILKEILKVSDIFEMEILLSTGDVLEFPAKDGEDFLLSAIDNAKSRIWIKIYSWTKMSNIYNTIKEAKNRWVDVRVILEWNVYNSPYIN